ncbi:hypothetical protein CL629_03185 [bacterium]|nr:hypothetical protein [bacterium]|tara:strand:+ start:594 stop:836 length:243 start_codon:yes stop_codon:yes gene_type:complete
MKGAPMRGILRAALDLAEQGMIDISISSVLITTFTAAMLTWVVNPAVNIDPGTGTMGLAFSAARLVFQIMFRPRRTRSPT